MLPRQIRLIAGAYLISAGVTGGIITIEDIIPKHLEPCMTKLSEIGLMFDRTENSITADGSGRIRAARIRTGKYPMFETDFQQPVTVLLLEGFRKKHYFRQSLSDAFQSL